MPNGQQPVLLVAATGGHLSQLLKLLPALVPSSTPRRWATFDTPQSRRMLESEEVDYVSYIGPRQLAKSCRVVPTAVQLIKRHRPSEIISTGSAVAVPFMLSARSLGVPCHYVESAARSDGPSLTGRIVSQLPGVDCSTQYWSWASPKWRPTVSVFDLYQRESVPTRAVKRLVVTLGTIEGFAFNRLVSRLKLIIPSDVEVFWQLDPTTHAQGMHNASGVVDASILLRAIEEADAVIAHAGIGSALSILDAGLQPILIPRRRAFHEHVDDHQLQIAGELQARGLGMQVDASALCWEDVVRSTTTKVLQN